MADIFEEVEEGLRQEKLTVAWKKYGIFAYLAVALIIGGVGLNEYLQYPLKACTQFYLEPTLVYWLQFRK